MTKSKSPKPRVATDRRATITDVAAAAGVSKTTVSHVLSGLGRINANTRLRTLEAIRKLNYHPSMMARGLRTGRAKVLAIANSIPPEIAAGAGELHYYMRLAHSAAVAALNSQYALVLIPPSAPEAWLRSIDIDGALVLDPRSDDSLLQALRARRVPVVTVGRDPDASEKTWCVDFDYARATTSLLDHFAEHGSCKPALILAEERRSYSMDILRGYERWVRRRGLTSVVRTAPERGVESAGRTAMAGILRSNIGINAVFAPLDTFAVGALQALTEAGLSVPRDFQVATIDGVRPRLSKPTLTALEDLAEESARCAVKLLIQRIAHPDATPKRSVVTPHLIIRDSTRR
jgi:DNA-binding LacI/PurR family transcriptional regulator